MALLLSASDIAGSAPPLAEIIALVAETYRMEARGEAEVPAKVAVNPRAPGSFLHAIPAWVSGADALGMKWISYFPENKARGLPDSTGVIILADPESGAPVAIMEGMWITYARTSACAAVASQLLAANRPRRLGLIGCGGLGGWSLRMLAAAHPSIDEVFVASRRAATREAFCEAMAREGPWRLFPVDDVRQAVEGMDIVVSSVPKLEEHPVRGAWWSAGAVMIPLDVTGAWDDDVYRMADVIAHDGEENLRRAFERYRPNLKLDPRRSVRLQDLAAGSSTGRKGRGDRILVYVTGIGSVDMVLAREIFRRATEAGRGRSFDLAG